MIILYHYYYGLNDTIYAHITQAQPMFQRAFLKWPGGKYRILDKILSRLPAKKQLIEPFVGSAVVFMNADYEHYLLNDVNPDLINVYQQLKDQGQSFINYAQSFFTQKHNQSKLYYSFRRKFNESTDKTQRAALFIYLNRHGFNGLCRYNGTGGYNVPFGQYTRVYFPERELQLCQQKLGRATLSCAGFESAMDVACQDSVIYADPPYVPLSQTSQFTAYASSPFGEVEQRTLAEKAKQLAKRGVSVLLSNHDTAFTRLVYEGAVIDSFKVQRNISAKAQGRQTVQELLALFGEGSHENQ
jgi:DNA adenine methylase